MDEGLNYRLGQPQEQQQVRETLCQVALWVVCDNGGLLIAVFGCIHSPTYRVAHPAVILASAASFQMRASPGEA